MKQEEKDLLLKDLCGRLPYFVKVQIKNEIVVLNSICDDDGYHFNFIGDDREGVNIEQVKPYLFPLSSMTEEQKKECQSLIIQDAFGMSATKFTLQDFYNKYHFDHRGLIPMGLAEDATGKNVYQ